MSQSPSGQPIKMEAESVYPAVSVVIPAFNEGGAVVSQVQNVSRVLNAEGIPHEILVVDDGSDDDTAQKALEAGVRVLQHVENHGYGAAIKTGIMAARYEIIAITDADGTYPADQLPAMLETLQSSDMVVAARVGEEVHIPWVRRPAKWVLGKLASHIAGQDIPDLNSGLRVFRREVIQQYFSVLSNRFSFTTTSTLAFLGDDYHVSYLPINYYKRIGRSKIRPRHFMDFTILVLRMAMLFQPLKVFVPLAGLFGITGVLKAGFDVALVMQRAATFGLTTLYQPVLSTSAILLFLTGLQLLLIGMMAEGVLRKMSQQNRPTVMSRSIRSYELSRGREGQTHEVPDTVLSKGSER